MYVSGGPAGNWGAYFPLHTLSRAILVLEAGLTSVFLGEMQTPRCKGNMDSYFAVAWLFPRLTAPGPSNAGFPEGCQGPKKKSSMRVLAA